MSTTIHSASSEYGTYRIVDTTYNNRPSRLLYGTDNSPQSGIALDDDPELLFDYNQRFLEMIMSHHPRKILVIGGGAGTLPAAAYRLFSNLTIDAIEIDGLLVELAFKYFDLPRSPRLRPIVDDAHRYLNKTNDRYDMIIIDAFSGYTVPPHLLQLSAIIQYQDHLSNYGTVAINFIAEYKQGRPSLAHEIIASFSEVFSYVDVYQSDPGYSRGADQNLILVASENEIHFDYLQSEKVKPA